MSRWGLVVALGLLMLPVALANHTGLTINMASRAALDLSPYQPVYQEAFESTSAQETLRGILLVGPEEDGPWQGELTGSSYRLSNTLNGNAVRYFFMRTLENDTPLAGQPVTLEVTVGPQGELSQAGLVYGLDPETRHYFAFVIDNSTYALYRRDDEGFSRVVSASSSAILPGQANTLAIVPRGAERSFYVNGTHLVTLSDGHELSGATGIVAIGTGSFSFNDFTVYAAAQDVSEEDDLSQISEGDDPEDHDAIAHDMLEDFLSYHHPEWGFSFMYPASWQLNDSPSGVEASNPEAFAIFVVERQASEEGVTLAVLSELLLESLLDEVPDAEILSQRELTFAGHPARETTFRGTNPDTEGRVTATTLVLRSSDGLYYLIYGADDGPRDYGQVFADMLSSFTLPPQHAVDDDPFVGTFATNGLSLTIEGAGERYVGIIHYQGQTYPFMAQAAGNSLSGTFESSGVSFEFSATLDGDTLTFSSGPSSFDLRRQ